MANRFHLQGGNAASWYAAVIVPLVFEPHSADLVKRARLTEGMNVVDLACGDGVVARHAASLVGPSGSVIGIDLNEAFVAEATSHPGLGANTTFRVADACNTGLDDGSADVVFCQQGWQFMPDHTAFAAEMLRILAPGGRAVVSVWRDEQYNPWATVLNEPLAKHLGPEAAEGRAVSFQFGDRETLRAAFVAGGFEQVSIEIVSLLVRHRDPDQLVAEQLGHPMMSDKIAALDEAGYDAFAADVMQGFDAFTDDHGIALPFQTHIVTASRVD